MRTRTGAARGVVSILVMLAGLPAAWAVPVELDPGSSLNGITDIYSATFDPPLSPCGGSSPPYCAFFGGDPPATRALLISPNPTTVENGVPGGIGPPAPPAGSYLDLTLGAGNTTVTFAGGSVRLPVLGINISGSTNVVATGAGFVVNFSSGAPPVPPTVALDANGRAEFLVNLAPALAADFSTLATVVTSCDGPLCALIPILSLDMIRYRMVVDYAPDFETFTVDFIGQTANNSMVFATLNSRVPDISVTDSQPPANDLAIPFGDVTDSGTATRTVTVANPGGGRLAIGNIAQSNEVLAPFAIINDGCSGTDLLLNESCTFDVTFAPGAISPYADSFDIPSNDADEGIVTVTLSGNGVATPVPDIVVTDSVAPADDGQLPFGDVLAGDFDTATVTVRNSGTANLVIGQVAGNPLAAPFSITADTCSSQSLAPAATCAVTIRFAPVATGVFSGGLGIPSNDADSPTVAVAVSGAGVGPDIRVTDPTDPNDDRQFSFSNVRVGDSFDRTVTITNVGQVDLLISGIAQGNSLAAPISLVDGEDNCSGQTLAPAAFCSVRLRFAPTALGPVADAFDIQSNDLDEPTVTVDVTGTGVEAPVAPATPNPSGADSGFMAMDPLLLGLLGMAAALAWQRRRQ